MEGDFTKSLPQDIPVIVNEKKVANKFGGSDLVLVVVELDQGADFSEKPVDVRDPRIIRMLADLQGRASTETEIDQIISAGTFFPQGIPKTLEGVKSVLGNIPGSDGFFNKDYSITLVYIYANVGGGEKAVTSFTKLVQDNIDSVSKPAGVKTSITGGPPIGDTILKILWSDAVYTITLAAAVILVLLIVLQKSLYKGVLVFIPLCFGLTWTLGSMGYLNIPLSVATVAVGAMVLGLGVEYGIFVVERYMEESEQKGASSSQSVEAALSGVGSAILGSGLTTVVGFGSLTLAIMPLLQKLGQTLALGIASCLVVAVFVNPSFIVVLEKATKRGGECR